MTTKARIDRLERRFRPGPTMVDPEYFLDHPECVHLLSDGQLEQIIRRGLTELGHDVSNMDVDRLCEFVAGLQESKSCTRVDQA